MFRSTWLALACACVATVGLAVAANAPASAADPTPPTTANALPAHLFAPFASPTNSLVSEASAAGTKFVTLDYLQTPSPGSCTVDWQGNASTPVGTYADAISALQASGGQVVASFGGPAADANGTDIADSCHDVSAIATAYETVISTYNITRIDLDVEGDSLRNNAGIQRRNQALKLVFQWAGTHHFAMSTSYTLPGDTNSGLTQGGSLVLENAASVGATVSTVDVMAFNFDDNLPQEMADSAETVATHTYEQLHQIYPLLTPSQLWSMVGLCEDIGTHGNGRDDVGAAETFTLADAASLENFAASHGLGELTFRQLEYDNTNNNPFSYSKVLDPLNSLTDTPNAATTSVPLTGPGNVSGDPHEGLPRGISCPSETFCAVVDQTGNVRTWDGTNWSKATSLLPTSPLADLTAISCASDSSCVTVDTVGDEVSWNGTKWSQPAQIDPSGAGLTAVSCSSNAFCVAVDGAGNAVVRVDGTWSPPQPIDTTGAALEAVSCTSASFCVAADWAGNVMLYNGTAWSGPQLADQAGDLDSISCVNKNFCLAFDSHGNYITYDSDLGLSAPVHQNTTEQSASNGNGGGIYVSCTSKKNCVEVDGAGFAYTWDGRTWSNYATASGGAATDPIDATGGGFEAISCASDTLCVAPDLRGDIVVMNEPHWIPPAITCTNAKPNSAGQCTLTGQFVDPSAGVLTSVSCPTKKFCAAVDSYGNALTFNGTAWSAPQLIDAVSGRLTAVSCVSATFCLAVDGNGYSFTWDGADWSLQVFALGTQFDPDGGALTSVSCVSSTFCVAGDDNGRVWLYGGAAAGWSTTPTVLDAGRMISGVACPLTTFCLAVDSAGHAAEFNGQSWIPEVGDEANSFTAVSCVSPDFCTAVDDAGSARFFRNGKWTAPNLIASGGDLLTAVTCVSDNFCVVTDWNGSGYALNGPVWTALGPIDQNGGGLTGASCASVDDCVLVDFAGNLVSPTVASTGGQTITTGVTGSPLSLKIDDASPVVLGNVTLNGQDELVTGTLHPVTVVDPRGTNAGWTLTGQVSDFSGSNGGSIAAADLGWAPTASFTGNTLNLVDSGTPPTVFAGATVVPGLGLSTAHTLCYTEAGASNGQFSCGGGLSLGIPYDTPLGSYSATLTLTLA